MRKNNTKNRPNAKKSNTSKKGRSGTAYAMKLKVKKGDTVMLVSGKDKGKIGIVLEAFPKTGRVVVEGIAMIKRHLRKTGRGQSGRIVERPASVNASNVMLVDPGTKKPTRVGREKREGKTVRIAKKSKTVIK